MVQGRGLKSAMLHHSVSRWVCTGKEPVDVLQGIQEMQKYDVGHSGHATVLIE
jgi:hypothetical protein